MTTITISRSELLSRLQTVSKIIALKQTVPIMDNVLLDIQSGSVRISAADYQGRINTTIEGIFIDNDTTICLEPKKLIEALKTLPEQPLAITIDDNYNFSVKYKGGKFEMLGLSPEPFPKEKEINNDQVISISAKILLDGIEKTIFCAATDELRPIMTSVYVDITEEAINFVASDGHKLALFVVRDEPVATPTQFPIPLKIAAILKSIIKPSDDKVNIFISGNSARFEYGSDSIVATLLEGRYPNYRSVIPTNNDKVLSISTSELKGALKRVSVFSNQSSSLVKLELTSNQLKLSAQDIDFSVAADETISCEYSNSSISIGFKGNLLTELISSIPSPELQMSFSEPSRATLITPIDEKSGATLTYLLMPMMLAD